MILNLKDKKINLEYIYGISISFQVKQIKMYNELIHVNEIFSNDLPPVYDDYNNSWRLIQIQIKWNNYYNSGPL